MTPLRCRVVLNISGWWWGGTPPSLRKGRAWAASDAAVVLAKA